MWRKCGGNDLKFADAEGRNAYCGGTLYVSAIPPIVPCKRG